jgi:flagellar biosynthesis protein
MDEDKPHEPNIKPKPARPVAVALKGDGGGGALPKLVAAGRGKLAEQILALAFKQGIKVREDADLAELLVKLELDTPIPSEAIVAVAEILARVYQANAALASLSFVTSGGGA